MLKKLIVKNIDVNFFKENTEDFISLTDIARYKNSKEPKDVVKNWIKTRNTIEFLGLWETINNNNFKGVEFDAFKNEADVLNVALFGITAKEWRDKNPKSKGNIRDYADVLQLVCLVGLESLNANFIRQGMSQAKRLRKLNEIAIIQIRSLVGNKSIKKIQ